MLIHGVTFTAELNWAKVLAPLARSFPGRRGRPARPRRRDQRGLAVPARGWRRRRRRAGPGDGDRPLRRRRVLDGRHDRPAGPGAGNPRAWCRAWCCAATARNVLGSPAERLAALALPAAAAAIRWNPLGWRPVSARLSADAAGLVGIPATARRARAQLRRTSLGTALSAVQAVCEFTSHAWIGQVDVPAAVLVTTRDRRSRLPPAEAGRRDPRRDRPRGERRSRGLHHRAATVHPGTAPGMLVCRRGFSCDATGHGG